jgi:hypothetical protein
MKNQSQPKYLIGIDIGGTKIKAVLLDKKKIVKSIKILTPDTKSGLKNALQDIVKKLKPKEDDFLIGIGAPGTIKNTSLLSAKNIAKVKEFDFREIFPKNIPLLVDNDGRCFLRGEFTHKSTKTAKSVFGLTIGTGVGRAYAENGIIQKIKSFEHSESWEGKYQKIRNTKNFILLSQFLGQKLSLLIKQYNPQIVIIGGGVLENKDFFNNLRREFKKQGVKSKIKCSKLGDDAVPIGAVSID